MLQRFFLILLIFSFVAGQLVRLDVFGVVFPLLDASVLLFVVYSIFSHRFSSKKYFENKYFLIFATTLIISNLVNYHLYSSVENLKGNLYLARFVLYSMIMGVDFSVVNGFKPFTTIKIVNLIGGIIAPIGIFQFVFLPDLRFLQYQNWDDHLMRLTFPYLDPSFTGAILLVFLIILVVNGLKPFTTIKIVTILLELVAIILTFSRATWIVGLIIFCVYIIENFKKNKKLILWGLGGIGGLGILILLFIIGNVKSQTLPYGNKITRTETLSSRLTGINKAVQIWQKNPIFGVGFNHYLTYQLHHGFYVKNGVDNRGEASVENSFIFIFVTSGILGFVCFGLWIWDMMRRIEQIEKYILVAILIGSLFNNLFFYPFILPVVFIVFCHCEE